jgi:ferredoxin
MSVVITPSCIACGACLWECPTEAIDPGDPRPVVQKEACTECYGSFPESQCVVVCPVDAITVFPESAERLEARFRRRRPGLELHDTWLHAAVLGHTPPSASSPT